MLCDKMIQKNNNINRDNRNINLMFFKLRLKVYRVMLDYSTCKIGLTNP